VIGPSATSAWRFLLALWSCSRLTRPHVPTLDSVSGWRRSPSSRHGLHEISASIRPSRAFPWAAPLPLSHSDRFCVAALGKRTPKHLALWGGGRGVVALTAARNGLNLTGVLFAAGAGVGWAAYVFASHHLGGTTRLRRTSGLDVDRGDVTLPLSIDTGARLAAPARPSCSLSLSR